MSAPVIDNRTSILASEAGRSFIFQPAALPAPTSWSATGLPAGLEINATTGKITGTPTEPGVYLVTLSATLGEETGTLTIVIPILAAGALSETDGIEIAVDVDVVTGLVTIPGAPSDVPIGPPSSKGAGAAQPLERPLLVVKRSDRYPLAIGIKRDGVLQDLAVSAVKVSAKEFEGEPELALNDGTFTKIGGSISPRFLTDIFVDPNKFSAILSGYEDDNGTYFDALAEIEIEVGAGAGAYEDTQDLALGSIEAEALINKTAVFTGLPKATALAYTLTLDLILPSREDQQITLVREFSVQFTGGVYVVSEVTGDATGDGEETGGEWQATLTNISLAGGASGLNVQARVETSEETGDGDPYIRVPLSFLRVNSAGTLLEYVDPYEAEDDYIEVQDDEEEVLDTVYLSVGNSPATVLAIFEGYDVGPIPYDTVEFTAPSPGFPNGIVKLFLTSDEVAPYLLRHQTTSDSFSRQSGEAGESESEGVLRVTLEGAGASATYRRTSQTFILRPERDLIQ